MQPQEKAAVAFLVRHLLYGALGGFLFGALILLRISATSAAWRWPPRSRRCGSSCCSSACSSPSAASAWGSASCPWGRTTIDRPALYAARFNLEAMPLGPAAGKAKVPAPSPGPRPEPGIVEDLHAIAAL